MLELRLCRGTCGRKVAYWVIECCWRGGRWRWQRFLRLRGWSKCCGCSGRRRSRRSTLPKKAVVPRHRTSCSCNRRGRGLCRTRRRNRRNRRCTLHGHDRKMWWRRQLHDRHCDRCPRRRRWRWRRWRRRKRVDGLRRIPPHRSRPSRRPHSRQWPLAKLRNGSSHQRFRNGRPCCKIAASNNRLRNEWRWRRLTSCCIG
jgi:hypothetical protein